MIEPESPGSGHTAQVGNGPTGSSGTSRAGAGRQDNTPARVAVWAAGVAALPVALVLLRDVPVVGTVGYRVLSDVPAVLSLLVAAVPVAAVVAVVAGAMGLSRARRAGGGGGEALVGLVGGIVMVVASVAVGVALYLFAHSTWQF